MEYITYKAVAKINTIKNICNVTNFDVSIPNIICSNVKIKAISASTKATKSILEFAEQLIL